MAFSQLSPYKQACEIVSVVYAQMIQRFDVFLFTTMGSDPVAEMNSKVPIPQADLKAIVQRMIGMCGYETAVRFQSDQSFEGSITKDGDLIGYFTSLNLSSSKAGFVFVSINILPTPIAATG